MHLPPFETFNVGVSTFDVGVSIQT